jgi:hypothetical protein
MISQNKKTLVIAAIVSIIGFLIFNTFFGLACYHLNYDDETVTYLSPYVPKILSYGPNSVRYILYSVLYAPHLIFEFNACTKETIERELSPKINYTGELPENNYRPLFFVEMTGYRRGGNILVWEDMDGVRKCACKDGQVSQGHSGGTHHGCNQFSDFFPNDARFDACRKWIEEPA